MFRRTTPGGSVHRFDVAGLWGGGNTIIERDLRLQGGGTVYSMWDGHALFGPHRPGAIERYPALIAMIGLREHQARYAFLPDDQCRVWLGDEVLGIGCEAACADIDTRCPGGQEASCLDRCALWPRSIAECYAAADGCEDFVQCNDLQWEERFLDGAKGPNAR